MVLTLRPHLVAAALTGLLVSAGASAATLYQQLLDAAGVSQQSDTSTGTPYAARRRLRILSAICR